MPLFAEILPEWEFQSAVVIFVNNHYLQVLSASKIKKRGVHTDLCLPDVVAQETCHSVFKITLKTYRRPQTLARYYAWSSETVSKSTKCSNPTLCYSTLQPQVSVSGQGKWRRMWANNLRFRWKFVYTTLVDQTTLKHQLNEEAAPIKLIFQYFWLGGASVQLFAHKKVSKFWGGLPEVLLSEWCFHSPETPKHNRKRESET